jgi:hypothetical protein
MHRRTRLALAAIASAAAVTMSVGSDFLSAAPRDGSRDFDVLVGNWRATLKRLDQPLSGSNTWTDYEGTQRTRNIWGGRASLTEFDVRNRATGATVQGLTLRLYNPATGQWSLYWANAKDGALDLPPVVGEFKNGRGEFWSQEERNGRAILVRYVWSDITATTAHFEQSFSADGGKTWEANWVSDMRKESATPTTSLSLTPPARGTLDPLDGADDFDVLVGTWKASLRRLAKPLSGSTTWTEFDGEQKTFSAWNGRATVDEFSVHNDATDTHVDGLTLRLYNPASRQWNIYWANAKRGTLDTPPMVGQFKDGRGEFYDQELFEGRAIFVRYVWSDITATSGHFEQSFSADGGKTWEANWVSDIRREKP